MWIFVLPLLACLPFTVVAVAIRNLNPERLPVGGGETTFLLGDVARDDNPLEFFVDGDAVPFSFNRTTADPSLGGVPTARHVPRRPVRFPLSAASADGPAASPSEFLSIRIAAPARRSRGYAAVVITFSKSGSIPFGSPLFFSSLCADDPDRPLHFEGQCIACPAGAFCPGGERVWPQEGYWSLGEASGSVVLCEPPSRCRGGRFSACARGYAGEYCGRCSEGYRMERDICVKCSGTAAAGSRVYYMIVVGTIAFCVLVMHDRLLTTLLSAIMTLQVLAAVGKMATSEMPPPVRAFYSYLSVLNLDFEGLHPGCTGLPDASFTAMFFGNAAFVVSIWIALAVCLGVLWAAIPRRRRFYANRVVSSAVLVYAIFFYILTSRALEAIVCYKIDGVYRLQSDRTMVCWEGPHIKLAASGCFALAVATIAVPYYAMIVFRRREFDLFDDKRFRSRYGMLYDAFKQDNFLFGLASLFVDVVLAVASTVLRYRPVYQVGATAGVLLWYVIMLTCKRPFRSGVEALATFVAFLTAVVGSAINFVGIAAARTDVDEIRSVADTFSVSDDGTPSSGSRAFEIMAYVVVSFTAIVCLAFVGLFFREVIVAFRHRKKYGIDQWDDEGEDLPVELRVRPEDLGLFPSDYDRVGSEIGGTLSIRDDLSASAGAEELSSGGHLSRENSLSNLRREHSFSNLRRENSVASLGADGSPGALRREGSSASLGRVASSSSIGAQNKTQQLQQREQQQQQNQQQQRMPQLQRATSSSSLHGRRNAIAPPPTSI